MKQLEELEKKVLCILKKNKDLLDENTLLKLENDELKEKSRQLEAAMVNKNKNSESLEQEKSNIKNSIEELLKNISSLETKNGEALK